MFPRETERGLYYDRTLSSSPNDFVDRLWSSLFKANERTSITDQCVFKISTVTIFKIYYKAYMLSKTVIYIFLCFMAMITSLGTMISQLCIVEELLAKLPAIRVGSGVAGITRQQYVDRLTWIKELLRQSSIVNWRDRQNFARVSQALEVLKLEDSNGSIRKQPYCVVLTGFPGCGKSRYALEIATACLRERYGNAYAGDIVTLNETDEFQSEYRTNHKVVIFDDLGAEVIKSNSPNPWRKVLDFVNNVRKTSLNPNVEMKGNVFIEPDLVIITTNLKRELSVSSFMAASGAIYRRIQKYIKLEDGYEKARLHIFHKAEKSDVRVYDNIGVNIAASELSPEISRKDLLKEITTDFQRHLEKQSDFVAETNGLLDIVESKTLFQSFYSDIILPMLFTKIPLDAYMEAQLPWYHRLGRKFCVENKQMAVCQNSIVSLDDSEILMSQSGVEYEDLSTETKNQVQFFKNNIDWKWYACISMPPLEGVLVFQDAIYDCQYHKLYSKKVHTSDYRVCGGIPSHGKTLEIAKTLYELENCSVCEYSTDNSINSITKIPTENQSDYTLSPLFQSKSRWGDEGVSLPKNILPPLLKQDDVVPLSSSDLSKSFGQGFRTVIDTAPSNFDLIGYEVDLKRCKPDLIYRCNSEKYGFVYIIVEIVTKGLSKGVVQLSKSIDIFRKTKSDILDNFQVVGVLLTPHHCKYQGKYLPVEDIKLKRSVRKWHRRIKDRCGAVELTDDELQAEIDEVPVMDHQFGLTFMRRHEFGDIPYDANGNFDQAMYARDL